MKKETQQAGIKHVADFESMAKTNEELGNATLRPNFSPCANLDSDSCRISDANNQSNGSDVDIKSTKKIVRKNVWLPVSKERKRNSFLKSSNLTTTVSLLSVRLEEGQGIEEADFGENRQRQRRSTFEKMGEIVGRPFRGCEE